MPRFEQENDMKYQSRQRSIAITLAMLLPVLLIVATPLLAKGNGNGNGHSKLSHAVKIKADRGGPEMVDVIVQYDAPLVTHKTLTPRR